MLKFFFKKSGGFFYLYCPLILSCTIILIINNPVYIWLVSSQKLLSVSLSYAFLPHILTNHNNAVYISDVTELVERCVKGKKFRRTCLRQFNREKLDGSCFRPTLTLFRNKKHKTAFKNVISEKLRKQFCFLKYLYFTWLCGSWKL